MKLDSAHTVKSYLIRENIITGKDEPLIERLSGGVSCEVWKVHHGEYKWVLKQALERLNVKADWYADIERIHREHEVMEALHGILPEKVIPAVVYKDYVNHVYIMTAVEGNATTWKEELFNENFSVGLAEKAATFLTAMHSYHDGISPEDQVRFRNQKYFRQLRIEAFHETIIQKHPYLSPYVQQLIEELIKQQTCLVHGDFSPKNMLIDADGKLMFVDFEVTHWGNPVFDLAYCLGHLMLKAWYLNRKESVLRLIHAFLESYTLPKGNLIPHLGLLLLARMDGKSPVNYITDEHTKIIIRNVAVNWIRGKTKTGNVVQQIKSALYAS